MKKWVAGSRTVGWEDRWNLWRTETREEKEGVCRTVDWHLSSTWSHISDLISEVEADGATEEEFCDALDKSTDSSVA